MKKVRAIHSRGSSLSDPHWRFGLQCEVPRSEVPTFVDEITNAGGEGYQGVFVYPDYEHDRCGYAIEWYLPWKKLRFGYKVGVEFWVTDRPLTEMSGYIIFGEDHPMFGQTPTADGLEEKGVQEKLLKTLSAAGDVPRTELVQIRFMSLPSSSAITRGLDFDDLGLRLLPSVRVSPSGTPVSALLIKVRARSKSEGGQLAYRRMLDVVAASTLATGSAVQQFAPQSTSRKRIRPWVPALDCPPEVAYRGLRQHRADLGASDVSDRLQLAIRWFLTGRATEKLKNAVFAYHTALQVIERHPTLATVALFAALAPFRGPSLCPERPVCPSCSKQLGHETKGEARRIADALRDMFHLGTEDKEYTDLVAVLLRLYQRRRSAFVHDAAVGLSEPGQVSQPLLPSADIAFPPALMEQNDISVLRGVCQRALLQRICEMSGDVWDPARFDIKWEIARPRGMTASITLPARIPVGIRV